MRVPEEVHPIEILAAGQAASTAKTTASRKEVGTVRRLALLFAGATIWLFLAAFPVFADGGVHVAGQNSGVSTLTADNCAGCHRAHTAQGEYLINAPSVEGLCLTCHGASSTGSALDVMTGLQYSVGVDDPRGGVVLGALRGGGFDQARLDAGNLVRLTYFRNDTALSNRPKIGVGAPEDVTSAHIAMTENGLTNPGKAWGYGEEGTGEGPSVTVTCGSCHNPHGNGQYRILNKIPHTTADVAWTLDIIATTASNDRLYTETSHALLVGDVVTIAGTGTAADGASRVVATVSANYFTLTGIDIAADTGAAGTVTRTSGVPVTDASLPAAGDARNYTVMQVKGTEGTESTYLLYASQVAAAAASGTFNGIAGDYTATAGDYFVRAVPWNPGINAACDPTVNNSTTVQPGCATSNSAPNGRPTTFSPQITAWCASCHTRYFANNNPNPDTADPLDTGASWQYPRPGDDLFNHQHRTVAGRDCLTCHVSHGSNAAMPGAYSGDFPYPDGTTSASSRLLKVDNRGTCQACHDPTGTVTAGTFLYLLNGSIVADTTSPYDDMPSVP
jgi:predicted CXXCH cytochrome family protein